MLTRRGLLGAVVLVVAPRESVAAPRFPIDGRFHWWHPGGDPYQGTPAQALEMFAAHSNVSRNTLQELFSQMDKGGGSLATIRPGEPFDLMMSGKADVKKNVVAETHVWPKTISQSMRLVAIVIGGRVYELGLPAVCWNWILRSRPVDVQIECIPCRDCSVS